MKFWISIVLSVAIIVILINQKFMANFLKTSDGMNIAYNLYEVKNPKGWLILTHMMPATKESWDGFAKEMREFGYESIAFDLRGHGESAGGPDGYKNFTDAEHQASIKDLEAVWEFLKSRGAMPEKMALIGASIGANLSLQFAADHPEFKKIILLSPGLDYRGVKTESLAKKLRKDQSVVFASSKDDGDNVSQNQKLYNSALSLNKHLIIFDTGGHGTNLLWSSEYDLSKAIKKFLESGSIN